jgi:hypothetical protein
MVGNLATPRSLLVAMLALLALAAVACGSDATSEGALAGTATSTRDSADAADGVAAFPYATGPAVLVSAGYEPPGDRVDSTGAYLPANGKPTLVYVDAIW